MVKRKLLTTEDMRNNMRCFSEEGQKDPIIFEDPIPMPSADTIVRCYGWVKVPREVLPRDFEDARHRGGPSYYEDTSHYYALVYEYVSRSPRDRENFVLQENIDFFYYAGFSYLMREKDNWRGGKLVDFGDVLSPLRFRPDYRGPPAHLNSQNFFLPAEELYKQLGLDDESSKEEDENGEDNNEEERGDGCEVDATTNIANTDSHGHEDESGVHLDNPEDAKIGEEQKRD